MLGRTRFGRDPVRTNLLRRRDLNCDALIYTTRLIKRSEMSTSGSKRREDSINLKVCRRERELGSDRVSERTQPNHAHRKEPHTQRRRMSEGANNQKKSSKVKS